MIRKIIELYYSAMMYKQKKIPHDWLGRMAFILSLHFFLIISALVFNIVYFLNFKTNKIIYYIITAIIVYFVFYLNDKNMKKFILRFEPDKTYIKKRDGINLINIFIGILLILITFYLFIFSFKIQKYI